MKGRGHIKVVSHLPTFGKSALLAFLPRCHIHLKEGIVEIVLHDCVLPKDFDYTHCGLDIVLPDICHCQDNSRICGFPGGIFNLMILIFLESQDFL